MMLLTYIYKHYLKTSQRYFIIFIFILSAFSQISQSIFAYSTNMDASVVIGQTDFITNTSGTSSTKLSNVIRGIFVDRNGRLIVADQSNQRVLIWNSIPTTSGAPADLVLGQPDFTSNTADNGGRNNNTFNAPNGVFSTGDKLIVSEDGANRVLIWNTFPTQNRQPADVVIGKSSFTDTTSTCDQSHLGNTQGVTVHNNKLIVASRSQNRILIWNSIPTTNGAPADLVLGQPDFTHCTALTTSQNSLSDPRSVQADSNGRLLIGDRGNRRILIWNEVPTISNTNADLVVGQPNFITGSVTVANINTVGSLIRFYSSGSKLFVPSFNRVLLFNSFPSSNNPSGDIVLGQSNFTNSSANGGGSISSKGFSSNNAIFEQDNKLFVADETNARILIFDNLIKRPGISLNHSPERKDDESIRLKGVTTVDSPYVIQSVQYTANGGGFQNATPVDGSFNSISEDFYFDFDPKSNNNSKDGYTVRIKSINNNTDITDNLFYFQPFTSDNPSNNSYTTNPLPSFSFTINKGRFQDLKENLSKFQILLNKDNTGWLTYIDDIPIDYEGIKNNNDNIQKTNLSTNGNGTYENKKLWVNYSNDNSTIKVYTKATDSLGSQNSEFFGNGGKLLQSGSYQWKVVAIDKSGHSQETESRYLRINSRQISGSEKFFPLTVLSITGIGNVHISTIRPEEIKQSYTTQSSTPTFYGIAPTNAKVALQLVNEDCTGDPTYCTLNFSTIANADSRFGINIPKNTLGLGKTYKSIISISLGENYNELPEFTLNISSYSSNKNNQSKIETQITSEVGENAKEQVLPSPTATIITKPALEQTIDKESKQKKCILFICF